MVTHVVVVGGGPAGLASAIFLAQRGIRVTVLEKSTYPIDKACGEGLMPKGVALLEQLGIDRGWIVNNGHPFLGIRYFSDNGKQALLPFTGGCGYGIRRTRLSQQLFERASSYPEITIQTGAVFTSRDKPPCDYLVGADGLHSSIRRMHHVYAAKPYMRWGIRQHFACAPWSNEVEVYWKNGIEAYVTPVSSDAVGVAFLCHKFALAATRSKDQLWDPLINAFPILKQRLGNAATISPIMAIGPLYQEAVPVPCERTALVGDASAYVDALTGEGLQLAFAQARALATVIAEGKDLSVYQTQHQRIFKRYYRTTRFLLEISKRPKMARRMIAFMSACPRITQLLCQDLLHQRVDGFPREAQFRKTA